ncbi:MAG: glycosyltransferase family 4 protein [Planctomycetota bacterium]|jgi:glycosyltransferase involved in cell wall biosynthesis
MKVGILCEHSQPDRGGAETYLAALAERLRVHGHEVVICARVGPYARPLSRDPGPADRPAAYRKEYLPWLRDQGAEVVLTTTPVGGCDFFQPHNGVLAVSVPSHYDSLPWGARHFRGWNPQRRAHHARVQEHEADAVRAPTVVLAVSPRVERDVLSHYPDARVVVRRPGVDLDQFSPPPDPSGPLLFASGNFRLKGLATLLRAVRRNPPLRVLVAGGKWRRPAPRAEFMGRVADMAAFYRSGSMLVHPTFYDSAASVVLEALASGLPVISTVRDGNADLAVEAGGAALEDPRDADALAAAIEAVRARADVELSRAVAERFPVNAMLDQVVETLTCGSSS